ncbi:MAG: glycosyltransferase [Gammaproteobacteria bacterium]|nr:glycosyltransferase [Gammaproteobacteria bacterium]
MRVLHVYRTYFPETQGGLEETIRQICLNTAAHGVESRVLCTSETITPRVVRRDEAAVFRSHRSGEIASCSLSIEAFPMFRRLLGWAQVVHYHFPWPLADVMHFTARVRVPTVVTYHADIVRQRLLGWVYAPLMRRFLGSVDRIVCTSPNYLASSKVLSFFGDRVDVVPIGLDEESYPYPSDTLVRRTHAKYGSEFFLFIGVLRYYKCLHILLQAMRDAPYRAVIVGSGPLEGELKSQCRHLGLGNVTFTGYLPDPMKVALLNGCRAVVSPSYLRAEAFGVSLLEGAMAGKPLITTEVGSGTSHVNVHGETGLVVEPRSPGAFREAMDTLHGAPELAEALGAGARSRFERLFNGRLMGERYADVYSSLLKSPG